MGRRNRERYGVVKTHAPGRRWLASGRVITVKNPEEWGVKASTGLPSSEVHHQEGEPPECQALKASGACIQESQEGGRKPLLYS